MKGLAAIGPFIQYYLFQLFSAPWVKKIVAMLKYEQWILALIISTDFYVLQCQG